MSTFEDQPQSPELPPIDSFIEHYGLDAPVQFPNGMSMTLEKALALEARFCKADDEKRENPARRLRYMSQLLGASGVLDPDHQFLTSLDIQD